MTETICLQKVQHFEKCNYLSGDELEKNTPLLCLCAEYDAGLAQSKRYKISPALPLKPSNEHVFCLLNPYKKRSEKMTGRGFFNFLGKPQFVVFITSFRTD